MLATERSISLITPQESSLFSSDKVTHFAQPCQQGKGQLGTCYPRHHYSPFLWSTTASLSKNLRTWKIHLAVKYYLPQPELGAVLLAGRVCRYNTLFIFQNILHSQSNQLLVPTRTSVTQRVSSSGWNSIRSPTVRFLSEIQLTMDTPNSPQPTLSFKLPMITWFFIELVISKRVSESNKSVSSAERYQIHNLDIILLETVLKVIHDAKLTSPWTWRGNPSRRTAGRWALIIANQIHNSDKKNLRQWDVTTAEQQKSAYQFSSTLQNSFVG